MILKAVKQLDSLDLFNKGDFQAIGHYFLLIFTDENTNNLKKLQLRFSNLLEEILENKPLIDKIKFIPIGLGGLSQILEPFKDFTQNYIQENYYQKFTTQMPSKKFPERNDHVFESVFSFQKSDFEISIIPTNTSFWRFGIRLSESDIFPISNNNEDRHWDDRYPYIVLTVGDGANKDGTFQWTNHNRMYLSSYIEKVAFEISKDYNGMPVILKISSHFLSKVLFTIQQENGVIIGQKELDLGKYKYCKFSAWADHQPYLIETQIKAIHKTQI